MKLTTILSALFAGLLLVDQSEAAAMVSKSLKGKTSANIIVSFEGGNKAAILRHATERTAEASKSERLSNLVNNLQRNAQDSQRGVLTLLNSRAETLSYKEIKTSWIANKILVEGASKDLIRALEQRDDVSYIEEDYLVPLMPFDALEDDEAAEVEWGVHRVSAPQVWKSGIRGEGVVVGGIDTGVYHEHEALKDNYRGDYGWFDPENKTDFPYDVQGHGTHTLGSVLGSHGVGVAPGAKWMACKGCRSIGCSPFDLLACAEFMTCPTDTQGENKDCSKAPDVINNSWGGPALLKFLFKDAVKAWIAGGIIPVFANGNSGPGCTTVGSPGDLPNVIAVGATTKSDEIGYFSSKGPGPKGLLKPDLSAPGHQVRSSVPGGVSKYATHSGTSMAAPHVAGVVALMLSKRPNLSFDEVRSILISSTDTDTLTPSGKVCDAIKEENFPNNAFGHGRVNAEKAVSGQIPQNPPAPAPTEFKPCHTRKVWNCRGDGHCKFGFMPWAWGCRDV